MRIVIDSNIFISTFISRSSLCSYVYEVCLLNHDIVVSETIISEIKEKLKDKFKFKKSDIRDLISLLRFHAKVVEVGNEDAVECRDEKDKHVLALALNARADVIISGDKDLTELRSVGKTKILTAKEFWLKYKG